MKRIFDVILAVLGLIAVIPLMAAIAIVILVSDGKPVFYSQRRIGRGGRPFKMLKFRTMLRGADAMLAELLDRDPEAKAEWEAHCKLRNDPRVIRGVGTFLRGTSLDELPQLFNIVRGDMSIVGPRPVEEIDLVRYGDFSKLYTSVRPGLTGPWQISGRSETTFCERIDFDVEYARNQNLLLDIVIMLKTAIVVARGRGAY